MVTAIATQRRSRMSTELILHGTWEEIMQHAGLLAGRRLMVIAYPEGAAGAPSGEPLSIEDEERLLDELASGPAPLPALPAEADRRDWIYGNHD
jgi:hypothetical protein